MKLNNKNLNSEEKAILKTFESEKLHGISKIESEKKRFQNIAKAHGIKIIESVYE